MKTALRRNAEQGLEEVIRRLTGRECEILNLVSLGHSNREIGVLLNISVRTVEVHRFHLMRKLDVRNVAQLLRRALQLGFLSSHDMRPRVAKPAMGGVVQFSVSDKPRKPALRRRRQSD